MAEVDLMSAAQLRHAEWHGMTRQVCKADGRTLVPQYLSYHIAVKEMCGTTASQVAGRNPGVTTPAMYSRDETVAAILAYYQEVIKQPYIDEDALKEAPADGWDNIDVEALRQLGKNDIVIDLLRHLPYLEAEGMYDRLAVDWETVPVDYRRQAKNLMDEIVPLPGHCAYLTVGVDREGFSRIIDTKRGTITNYSIIGYDEPRDGNEWTDPDDSEEWKRSRTLPTSDFCSLWSRRLARLIDMLIPNPIRQPQTAIFLTRADNAIEAKRLADDTAQLEEWHPDLDDSLSDGRTDFARAIHALNHQRTADAYNIYLKHGWPSDFNKAECRAELTELEVV